MCEVTGKTISHRSQPSDVERLVQKLEKHCWDNDYPLVFEILQNPYGPEHIVCQHYDRLDAVNDVERLFVDEWLATHAMKHGFHLTGCFEPLVYIGDPMPG